MPISVPLIWSLYCFTYIEMSHSMPKYIWLYYLYKKLKINKMLSTINLRHILVALTFEYIFVCGRNITGSVNLALLCGFSILFYSVFIYHIKVNTMIQRNSRGFFRTVFFSHKRNDTKLNPGDGKRHDNQQTGEEADPEKQGAGKRLGKEHFKG